MTADWTLTPLPSVDRYDCCPQCGGPGMGVAEMHVDWEHCTRWRCTSGCNEPWYVIRSWRGGEVDRVELKPPVPRVFSLDHLETELAWAIEPYAHRAGRTIAYAVQLGARLAAALAIDVDVRERSRDEHPTAQPRQTESNARRHERIERIRADAMFGRDDDQIPCDHYGYTHTAAIRAQQEDLRQLLDEIDRLRWELEHVRATAANASVARIEDLLAMAEGRCPIPEHDRAAVRVLREHISPVGEAR